MHDRSPTIKSRKTNASDACSRRERCKFQFSADDAINSEKQQLQAKRKRYKNPSSNSRISISEKSVFICAQTTHCSSQRLSHEVLKSLHLALVFILIKKANTLSDEYLFALYVVAIDAAAAELTSARLSAHEMSQSSERRRIENERVAAH